MHADDVLIRCEVPYRWAEEAGAVPVKHVSHLDDVVLDVLVDDVWPVRSDGTLWMGGEVKICHAIGPGWGFILVVEVDTAQQVVWRAEVEDLNLWLKCCKVSERFINIQGFLHQSRLTWKSVEKTIVVAPIGVFGAAEATAAAGCNQ